MLFLAGLENLYQLVHLRHHSNKILTMMLGKSYLFTTLSLLSHVFLGTITLSIKNQIPMGLNLGSELVPKYIGEYEKNKGNKKKTSSNGIKCSLKYSVYMWMCAGGHTHMCVCVWISSGDIHLVLGS